MQLSLTFWSPPDSSGKVEPFFSGLMVLPSLMSPTSRVVGKFGCVGLTTLLPPNVAASSSNPTAGGRLAELGLIHRARVSGDFTGQLGLGRLRPIGRKLLDHEVNAS